jgi:two-component system KDP operon response regulator KdpE
MPIIILSARSTKQHKIDALNEDANDYLTKPFSLGELLARI